MKTSPTSKWIIDASLLLGFCAAVLFDLTGLELHQWIGVGVGLLAGYHLFTHLDWVRAVTRRFFGKASRRSRLYYLIDALILGGFATIGVTGLLISTWLNLAADGMAALATVHEWTAYLSLAALFVKLALHWRWIVNVAGKFFEAPVAQNAKAGFPTAAQMAGGATPGGAAPGAATRSYTRREFIQLMGAAALSTVAVAGVAAKALDVLQAADNRSTDISDATGGSSASPTVTTNTGSASAASSAASLACTSCRRGKHCAYPGDCHDYVDTNGNNLCDHGECA